MGAAMSVAMNAAIKSMGTELDMMWWYDVVVWCGGMIWWYGAIQSQQPLVNIHDQATMSTTAITTTATAATAIRLSLLLWRYIDLEGYVGYKDESRTGNHEAFRPASALCFGRESNPYGHCCPQDFKSCVSTNSTTKAKWLQKYLNFT